MGKASRKQMIFSSKPLGVTTWIFFENRFVNLLKTVSMYWRICLPKAPALGTTRHEPQLAAVQGLARTSMSASFSAAEGSLTSRSFTGSRPCGVFTKTTISLPSSFLRVPSLFFFSASLTAVASAASRCPSLLSTLPQELSSPGRPRLLSCRSTKCSNPRCASHASG